jgi:ornithine carbamoyltransferase
MTGWLDTKEIGEKKMEHFLDIFDHSPEELQDILDLAVRLEKGIFFRRKCPAFQGQGAGNDFPKTQPADARFV